MDKIKIWWDCWYDGYGIPTSFRDLQQARNFILRAEKAEQEAKEPVKYYYF